MDALYGLLKYRWYQSGTGVWESVRVEYVADSVHADEIVARDCTYEEAEALLKVVGNKPYLISKE